MKIKKHFIFDELAEAEQHAINGFEDGKIDYSAMYLVAKYFRHKLKYGEVKLEKELISFCKRQDQNFNPVVERNSIKKWVTSAMKYGLRKVDKVTIKKSEYETLLTISSHRDRKLMLATLIIAKALHNQYFVKQPEKSSKSKYYYVKYSDFPSIINVSTVTNVSEIKLAEIFHKYKKHFFFYSPEKELIKVLFAKYEDEDIVMTITDFDDIAGYYEELFMPKEESGTPRCERCGKEFEKKTNRQKFCSDCMKDAERERKKQWDRKNRKKSDV